MLVSTRISELKRAVANGEVSKTQVLVNEIREIKNNAQINKLIEHILDKKELLNSNENLEKLNELKNDKNIIEKNNYQFFTSKKLLSDFNQNKEIKKGVSFVTVSMNREQNLLRALPTWLETEVDEIVIVDWSSKENLAEKLMKFNDPRVIVVQIKDEERWILTHAFNVGLKVACREKIYKLDSDIIISKNFITENKIYENEFIRGFWKTAVDAGDESQKYVNGTFGAFNNSLKKIGYYDERIMTYGWDDSDIYYRLVNLEGLVGKYIRYRSIVHQEQEQDERLKYQKFNKNKKFLDKFEITELENSKNKFKSYFQDLWGSQYPQQDYELLLVNEQFLVGNRITSHTTISYEDQFYSELFATRELLGWTHSDFHKIRLDALKSLPFAKLINELIRDDNETKFIEGIKNNKNIKIILCENFELQNAAEITISNIIKDKESSGLPIILVASLMVDLTINSKPNVYLINQNLAFAIHESLLDNQSECSFHDCIDKLDDSAQIVRLTNDSLVMSFWNFKDSIQHSVGNYSTDNSEERYRLTISLYDECNLYRLRDYLTCLLINLSIFECIEIFYERTNGILISLLSKLIVGNDSRKVGIKFWNRRPTYTELFEGNINEGDQFVSVIANADVFFDKTLSYISLSELQNTVLAVSRRDIYKKDGLYKSKLIKYPNGSPNILSADAWIASSSINLPSLNYQLGTIHCDSFFNNTILQRSEITLLNPALDLNVFHLHDERFNSSEEKQIRDAKEIGVKLEAEKSANGGIDPIAGVSWSSIQEYNRFKLSRLQRWRPNSIVLVVKRDTHIILILLLAHYLSESLKMESDIMIVLCVADLKNKTSLERFLGFLNNDNLQVDLDFDINLQTQNINFKEFFELIEESASISLLNYLRHQFTGQGNIMNSLSVDLDSPELLQINALKYLIKNNLYKSKELLDQYFKLIEDNSYELNYYLPYRSDYKYFGLDQKSLSLAKPKISFITSMFNASAYLPSFLENIHSAAIHSEGEVIIIDVNSHDRDEIIVSKYIKDNNISKNLFRYIRLDKDPGLYKTWEYGINISKSEVISNANVDDKRSASHSQVLTEFLHSNQLYAGACGSIWGSQEGPYERYTSRVNGEIWYYDNDKEDIGFSDLWLKDGDLIKSRNIMHCIPVWRKSLHEKYGFFDENVYGTSADWAFWLKCTKSGEVFKHIRDVFGKYYINAKSHNRINDEAGRKELKIIKDFIGIDQINFIKQ